jgi:hypothetical protein
MGELGWRATVRKESCRFEPGVEEKAGGREEGRTSTEEGTLSKVRAKDWIEECQGIKQEKKKTEEEGV